MQLTNEQKRIKIAEACGWRYKNTHAMWLSPSGQPGFTDCPDYLNDLNAMHEAEQVLTDEQLEEYFTRIHKNFSASQRAEAFGRTLNLW